MRFLALTSLFLASLIADPATAQQARVGERADLVVVDKSERTLWVYQGGKAIRTYRGLQFGDAPQGHKRFQGDEKTPEGR